MLRSSIINNDQMFYIIYSLFFCFGNFVDSTNANIKEKTATLRKKQNKDIKNLTTQNNKFRKQYEDVLHGDKTNLLPVLHSHPKMQLAFKNLNPQVKEL